MVCVADDVVFVCVRFKVTSPDEGATFSRNGHTFWRHSLQENPSGSVVAKRSRSALRPSLSALETASSSHLLSGHTLSICSGVKMGVLPLVEYLATLSSVMGTGSVGVSVVTVVVVVDIVHFSYLLFCFLSFQKRKCEK